MYCRFTDFDYQKKENYYYNIDEEFSDSFQSFINKLTKLCGTNLVLMQTNGSNEILDKFSVSYNFDQIKIGSLTGEKVDYFSVSYPVFSSSFCGFFFITKHVSKKKAIDYLLKQGFDFLEKRDNILHFCKDRMHLRLAYRDILPGIRGLEVTQGDVESDLAKRVTVDREAFLRDISLRTFITSIRESKQEFKQSRKKDKILAVVVSVVLLALFIGVIYLIYYSLEYNEEVVRKLTEIMQANLLK